jgi:two-component system cell cycle response regulator
MPSRELLSAGLARVRSRWPRIERIAPQHGHLGVSTKSAQLSSDFSHQMELADQALYAAKEDGRNRVRAAEAISLSSR